MNELFQTTAMFGVVLTVFSYYIGFLIQRRLRWAILNPLLIAVALSIAFLVIFNIDYETYDQNSQMIRGLLTPATVSLAVPLYNQIHLLRKDGKAIAIGIASGVAASLITIYLLSKLFSLSFEEYVTLMPKSITTAIAIGVTAEYGGIVMITVASIMVTGLLGSIVSETVFRALRIKHAVAQGVALGTSAHAMGTAKAMGMGETQGAMSSLAIVVAGICTVVAAPLFAGFY